MLYSLRKKSRLMSGFTPTPTFVLLQSVFPKIELKLSGFEKKYLLPLLLRRNKNTTPKLVSGFTFVEVIVVIGIIAILTTIAYASLTQIRAKSRDQKRVADVHEIQLALEYYFNKNGRYPEMIWPTSPAKEASSLKAFLAAEPSAPLRGEVYTYVPFALTSGGERCISYHLYTKLELKSATLDSKRSFNSLAQNVCGSENVTAKQALRINASDPINSLVYDLRP